MGEADSETSAAHLIAAFAAPEAFISAVALRHTSTILPPLEIRFGIMSQTFISGAACRPIRSGGVQVSASMGPSSCMAPILLPWSAFAQYMARRPSSLSKVTLEQQGANVLFHTTFNPYFRQGLKLFAVTDFVAELTQHLPPKGVHYIQAAVPR